MTQAVEAAGARLRSVKADEFVAVAIDFVSPWDFEDGARADRTLIVRVRKRDLVDPRAGSSPRRTCASASSTSSTDGAVPPPPGQQDQGQESEGAVGRREEQERRRGAAREVVDDEEQGPEPLRQDARRPRGTRGAPRRPGAAQK